MKKTICILLCFVIVLCSPIAIMANENKDIQIIFNSQLLTLDTAPIIINDRTMIPARAILETMGATIVWDDKTKTATIDNDGILLWFTADEPMLYTGYKTIIGQKLPLTELEVAPFLHNNRLFVPVRIISEILGAEVEWNAENKEIYITYDEKSLFNKYNILKFQLSEDSNVLNLMYFQPTSMVVENNFDAKILLCPEDAKKLMEHFGDELLESHLIEQPDKELYERYVRGLNGQDWCDIAVLDDVDYICTTYARYSDPSLMLIERCMLIFLRAIDNGYYYMYVSQW